MASKSINRVVILGHLGNDADTRFTQNGVARTTFSIATNRVWKDQNGDKKEETDWHNVVLWRAENLTEYLTKGKQVYLEGRLRTRSYEKDGERKYVTEVIAEEVILLSSGNGGAKEEKAEPKTQTESSKAPAKAPSPRNGNRAENAAAARRQAPKPPEDAGITDDDVPF